MSFRLRYYKDLEQISTDWDHLFTLSNLSYFCSLAWHKVVLAFLSKTFFTKKLNDLHYFTLDFETEVKLLGFFFVRKKRGQRILHFTHLLGPSDYYDLIYTRDFVWPERINIFNRIMADFGADRFTVNHIRQDSLMLHYLDAGKRVINFKPVYCVAVSLNNDYNSYYKSLKSGQRQNLRTAQNRLKRDNLKSCFKIMEREHLSQINFKYLKSLYKKRNNKKANSVYWKSKLYTLADYLLKDPPDMFDLEELQVTDFTLGVLEIEEQIAAYFFGFKRNKKIEINRVVINDVYKFYSPGILMFHEYVKLAIEEGIQVLDLTVGDEKYKYDLGGVTYEIFNIDS